MTTYSMSAICAALGIAPAHGLLRRPGAPWRPLSPQSANFQGLAMICCEPLSARPLISNGAGLPSYFISAGLGSNMSMVLGPPPM